MLENVTYGFRKPNVMDIKLGTVLYDDYADEAKRQRSLASAKNTTSLESGIRLSGFQVDKTKDLVALIAKRIVLKSHG